MKVLLLLLAYVCLAQCGPTKKQAHDQEAQSYEYEYAHEPALALVDSAAFAKTSVLAPAPVSHSRGISHPGFSVGGPLANIAKGAAEQAHTQLSNQHSAAGQAAFVAKNTLAQAAAQSAATAAAALAGKQIVVQGLEQQSKDAHVAVDSENLQLQQAERAASAARTTAKQAMYQLQVATAALNAAQATADRAAQAAAEAAAELAAQTTMLGQAKARAESVDEQLSAARLDYETTQAAAEKAANAAAAAQNNAAAAAAHVADNAAASALLTHEPTKPSPLPKLPPQHVPAVAEPALDLPALRPHGSLLTSAGLHQADALVSTGYQEAIALPAPGLLHEANGLHRSELLSLANALPTDNYGIKGYRY